MNGHDIPVDKDKVVVLLENQVADLKTQLEKAEQRETTLITERSKLLDMLSEEKAECRALMPPPAHETLFWELALRGYDLSSLRDNPTTAEILKIS